MTDHRRSDRTTWVLLLAALVAVKAAWFAADSTPMLFLGDSESYLATALHGWIPPDRSFLYGLLLRPAAVWPGSLVPLLPLQMACSIVGAIAMAWVLRHNFAAPRAIAVAAALAWAGLEPVALLYERYVMAEAVTLPVFALFVATSLAYVDTGKFRWLALAHVLGLLVLALRYSFVPIAWMAAIVLPALAFLGAPSRAGAAGITRWRTAFVHVIGSILLVAGLHQAYKVGHGQLAGLPPAYQYADGLFLAAAWAPLLEPSDFPDPVVGRRILDGLPCALGDRQLREAQRWYAGCLVSRIEAVAGPGRAANALAKSAAMSALKRDPLAVAILAVHSWSDWLDAPKVREALRYDRGINPPSAELLAMLRDRFALDASSLLVVSTATNRHYLSATGWLIFLALSPVFAWAVVPATARAMRRQATWLLTLGLCLLGTSIAASTKVVPRYMHVVAWLVALGCGAAVAAVVARVAESRSPLQPRNR